MKIKKASIECQNCEKFFIVAYNYNEDPLFCPFCGSTTEDDEKSDDKYDGDSDDE